jgi:hypothetical protein
LQTPRNRDVIFISHATPSDNAFAIWLASRLSLYGYNVWCDKEKLIGAEDWWRDIEVAIRSRTCKFVLVVSGNILDDEGLLVDGVGKEVALATTMKKQLGDNYFIVPMRIDQTSFSSFPIDLHRLNGIDCHANWADGLHRLSKVFERDNVPKVSDAHPSLESWREAHQILSRTISPEPEQLLTNWLEVQTMPECLNFYEMKITTTPSEMRAIASECSIPCAEHFRLLVSFAELNEMQNALGEAKPIGFRGSLPVGDFLKGKMGDIVGIKPSDARRKLSSIIRQAWDLKMEDMGLSKYLMANGNIAWWFAHGTQEDMNLRYVDLNGKSRKRSAVGVKGKRKDADGKLTTRYHWHLGFTMKPYVSDHSYVALQPRIIITEDGLTPLANKTRLNSVRRSVTSMWFNEKWRGLQMAFVSWAAQGDEHISLSLAANASIKFKGSLSVCDADFGLAADPVNIDFDDTEAEKSNDEEANLRIADPAFRVIVEDDADE